jgi:hypothetical protein
MTTNNDKSEPKKTKVPTGASEKTKTVLWSLAAGRCQYPGCNRNLIGDYVSGVFDRNFGFVAHIVAEKPNGPRGDAIRSPALVDDLSNLMLLCSDHHKLIDVIQEKEHPEERLKEMKAAHERRIEMVTGIPPERASHALRFGADIGSHVSPLGASNLFTAMLPRRYPAEKHPIDLHITNSAFKDHEPEYWQFQRENLRRQFAAQVRPRLASGEIQHLSVFGLAPQPLLIELGHLLCDITAADVHQLKREPAGWGWLEGGPTLEYRVRRASQATGPAALVLGLSATIIDDRITQVLGPDVAIWGISLDDPHNDVLRYETDLVEFRRKLRLLLNAIKAAHGEEAIIHVFPALPVAAAIEVGRVRQPKADLTLQIYDQNRALGGFAPTLTIGGP